MNEQERSLVDYTLDVAHRCAAFRHFSVRDAIKALRLANAMLADDGYAPINGSPSSLSRIEMETLERAIHIIDYLSDTQAKRLLH